MKFTSRRDPWMAVILIVSIGLFLWGTIVALIQGGLGSIVMGIVFVVFVLYICHTWYGTYYIMDENRLTIRYGLYKKVIPISEIRTVQLTNSPFIATTLSRFKIDITYGSYGLAIVSPANREQFIEQLMKRNEKIEWKK